MTNPRTLSSSGDNDQTARDEADIPVLNPASTEKIGSLPDPEAAAGESAAADTEADDAPDVSGADDEPESDADQARTAEPAEPGEDHV